MTTTQAEGTAQGSAAPPGGSGSAWVLIVGVVVVVALGVITVAAGRTSQAVTIPDMRERGLDWAVDHLGAAAFRDVTAHDALGRDRGIGDRHDWQVCFQTVDDGRGADGARHFVPVTGPMELERVGAVRLGVVKATETCPDRDQGVVARATTTMPDLVGRTAYIAQQALGDKATILVRDVGDRDDEGLLTRFSSADRFVTRGLGDWRVCMQSPAAGEEFDGKVVRLQAVRYDATCP